MKETDLFRFHWLVRLGVRIAMLLLLVNSVHAAELPLVRIAHGAFSEKILIMWLGAEQGLFRTGLDPLDVHLLISSFCFYRVSNRHTFGEIFQIDLPDECIKQRHREMICESVLRYLQA